MSEAFFTSDYVAQAEEFFWRAISTPRLARKATYLKAAAKSLEKAIGLAEASPKRHDGEPVEHAVRALGGRQPKLTPEQKAEILHGLGSGRKSAADLARLFRVHRATISRLATKARVAAPVEA